MANKTEREIRDLIYKADPHSLLGSGLGTDQLLSNAAEVMHQFLDVLVDAGLVKTTSSTSPSYSFVPLPFIGSGNDSNSQQQPQQQAPTQLTLPGLDDSNDATADLRTQVGPSTLPQKELKDGKWWI